MSVVSIKNVFKSYPLGKERIEAVKGVSFDIEKGEFAAISGPSGSGKSTILNMIGLILIGATFIANILRPILYELEISSASWFFGALVGAITGWIEGIFLNGFACLVKNTKETRDFVASIDQKLGNKD